MKKAKFSTLLICFASASLLTVAFALLPKNAPAQTSSVHLTMGKPSTAGTSNLNDYLLTKSQYVTSHNCTKGTPNWVSWQLNSSWLGSTPRQDDFRADTSLPAGCYRVLATSYQGSGFDRGHMTPSADRTSSVTNNSATFLMTNFVPQSPDNNQGVWESLETYCRTLVSQGNELYIISGPLGTGGTGSAGFKSAIDSNRITVPNSVWKVIVVVAPGTGPSGVTTNTRVIAVNIPNTQGIRSTPWRNYRVTVDSIESATGYNFLSNVSTSVQSVIEARIDNL